MKEYYNSLNSKSEMITEKLNLTLLKGITSHLIEASALNSDKLQIKFINLLLETY